MEESLVKKTIVTGASGMIGATLTRMLLLEGRYVCAIVRPNSAKTRNLPGHKNLSIVECDMDNLGTLKECIGDTFDDFYHFAWKGTFGDSRNDVYLQNINVKNTLDAVNAAADLGCKVFVGAGSQAEYGRVDGNLAPNIAVNPENGYGIAKYTAGKLSAIYAKQLGIKHVWGRILSVYGPYDNGFTMVMSTVNKLLNGERPQFTKGEQLWDFLYSDDAARAFKLMGDYGKDGAVYCVGSGQARPLIDYITQIKDTINNDLPLGIGEVAYASNQVMHLCADITSLTTDTGFVPQVGFAQGIATTIDWAIKHRKKADFEV